MMGDERFDLEVVGLCWSHDKEGEEGVCGHYCYLFYNML